MAKAKQQLQTRDNNDADNNETEGGVEGGTRRNWYKDDMGNPIQRIFDTPEECDLAVDALMSAYHMSGKGFKKTKDASGKEVPLLDAAGNKQYYPPVFQAVKVHTHKLDTHGNIVMDKDGKTPVVESTVYVLGRDEDDALACFVNSLGYYSSEGKPTTRTMTSDNVGQRLVSMCEKEGLSAADKKKLAAQLAALLAS